MRAPLSVKEFLREKKEKVYLALFLSFSVGKAAKIHIVKAL